MKKRGFLICFIGMDGTGKTTICRRLIKILDYYGLEFKYVHARLIPFVSKLFIFFGKIFLINKYDKIDYFKYSKLKKYKIKRYKYLFYIYAFVLFFDYIVQFIFKVGIPLIYKKNIICDRYVHDLIINDISVDMDLTKNDIMNLLNIVLPIFPKPDIIFLLDVDEKVAYQRKEDVPNIDYLIERRKIYLEIGTYCKMFIIDTSKNLDVLLNIVSSKIIEHFRF